MRECPRCGRKMGFFDSYSEENRRCNKCPGSLVQDINNGFLPVVQSGLILDAYEICHLKLTASYMAQNRESYGQLIVTNKRVIFTGTKNHEYSLKRILSVKYQYGGQLLIDVSSKANNGFYKIDKNEVDKAVAILYSVTRIAKALRQPTGNSRHIPQEVKQIVWQRDGGKCVSCGTMSELQFDHIIPFSKGGANTVENVQILCKTCNLRKGTRL